MNIDKIEIVRGILSVELRGLLFFAVAFAVIFFFRKRSARFVASCWRAVFAAATVIIVMGFAQPMLVMEMIGRETGKIEAEAPVTAMASPSPVTTAFAASSDKVDFIPTAQVAGSQSEMAAEVSDGLVINWPVTLLIVWGIGMLALLIRPLTGAIGLAKLHRQSKRGEGALLEEFHEACKQAGVSGLRLRELPAEGVPFVAGVLRPTLYVPANATEWDRSDWDIILRHEVAHVHHFDGLFNLLAQLCLAAFWVNPLAWIAYRQLKITQECAADDSVLCGGVSANNYADTLLKFCAKSVNIPVMAMPMARPSTMRVRIERILDSRKRRSADRAISRVGGLAMIGLAGIIGTTVLVRAEKAANQVLAVWTMEHLVKSITEPKAALRADRIPGGMGFAARFNQWGGTLNLGLMSGMLENDLYLSSPHEGGQFNVKSKTSFGHYNPAALTEMRGVLEEVLNNDDFVEAFQPAYDDHLSGVLQKHLRTYQEFQKAIKEDPREMKALKGEYNAWVGAGKVDQFEASFSRKFNHSIVEFEPKKYKVSWYESCFAAKFWTRRHLDGTADQFLGMLAMIMVKMDPTGPLANVPEDVIVKSGVTAIENGIRIDFEKSNVPAEQLEVWSRIDGGPWVAGATRKGVLEGDLKIEWEYRFTELDYYKSERQDAKLEVKGSLRKSIKTAIADLLSDDFQVRTKAQLLLDGLDVQATPLLKAQLKELDDVEQRLGLSRALKAIAK